ncbi:MAG: EamA family transporter [Actinobacteria bacterium]|nr:EamA family transporter [Actinomycetota bacterium]
MGAVLALLSSVLWGSGDFLGGSLSRRAHPVAVMGAAQGLAALGLLAIAVASGSLGATGYLPWAIASGAVGVVALGSFYSALADGTMGVVAPIASTGVALPVVVGLVRGDRPSPAQAVGIAAAVVGVVLATNPGRDVHPDDRHPLRPLLLAGLAGAGFGTGLVLVAGGARHSVVMTLLVMRVVNALTSTALLATVLRSAPRPKGRELAPLALIGGTDAAANGLYALATRTTLLSVAAVLASLYPAVTALLARRFHAERLRPVQAAGVLTILAGVVLIAAG